jgi:hypothetical protein
MIITSFGARIGALIGPLLPALYPDWLNDVMECNMADCALYLMWSYIGMYTLKLMSNFEKKIAPLTNENLVALLVIQQQRFSSP